MTFFFVCITFFLKKRIAFNSDTKVKYRQRCPKRKQTEANTFHVLPFSSAWDSTVEYNSPFLFTNSTKTVYFIHKLLMIHWSPKEITQNQALVSAIISDYLPLKAKQFLHVPPS